MSDTLMCLVQKEMRRGENNKEKMHRWGLPKDKALLSLITVCYLAGNAFKGVSPVCFAKSKLLWKI